MSIVSPPVELNRFYSERVFARLMAPADKSCDGCDTADIRDLVDEWQSLRFRILSVGLHSGTTPSVEQVGVPVREAGGIIHAPLSRSLIVLLPDIKDAQSGVRAADDLLALYNTARGERSHWVLDFSSITQSPPLLFLGFVAALRRDLARFGNLLTVVWMKQDLFPKEAMEGIGRTLGLKPVGGYLFSDQNEIMKAIECSSRS